MRTHLGQTLNNDDFLGSSSSLNETLSQEFGVENFEKFQTTITDIRSSIEKSTQERTEYSEKENYPPNKKRKMRAKQYRRKRRVKRSDTERTDEDYSEFELMGYAKGVTPDDCFNCPACKYPDSWDDLIECEKCKKYYHFKCGKVSKRHIEDKDFIFICSPCKKRRRERRIIGRRRFSKKVIDEDYKQDEPTQSSGNDATEESESSSAIEAEETILQKHVNESKMTILRSHGIHIVGDQNYLAANIIDLITSIKNKKGFPFLWIKSDKEEKFTTNSQSDDENTNIHEKDEYFNLMLTRKKRVKESKDTVLIEIQREYDPKEISEMTKDLPGVDDAVREQLLERYRSRFNEWYMKLNCGFSLQFYGVGSKIKFLNEFITQQVVLLQKPYFGIVIVAGYNVDVTVKSVLNVITKEIMKSSEKFLSLKDQVQAICKFYTEINKEYDKRLDDIDKVFDPLFNENFALEHEPEKTDLYIVVHNLDGKNFRSGDSQELFATLAAHKHIHFICSVDHINSQLLWDSYLESKFNFLRYDVTNYERYIRETLSTDLGDRSKENMFQGIQSILQSLTEKDKQVFKLLLQHRAENSDTLGVTLNELKKTLVEKNVYIVANDKMLEHKLKEFLGHKILKKRMHAGKIYYHVPYDTSSCNKILNRLILIHCEEDYYTLLGVRRDASEAEIKEAYKKLALKWHPDRHKGKQKEEAHKKFVKISHAYDVLKDPEKRRQYDMFGSDGQQGGSNFGGTTFHGPGGFTFHFSSTGGDFHFDPFDIFRDVFENDPFETFFSHHRRQHHDPLKTAKTERMSLHEYDSLYHSHKLMHQPWLIYLVSYHRSCTKCRDVVKFVDTVMEEMKGQVHVRIVEITDHEWLPENVHQVPAIIGLLDGQVTVYSKNTFSTQGILEFAHDLIPKTIPVEILKTLEDFDEFIAGNKNKVSVVLFSDKPKPTDLWKELAWQYRFFAVFGYVFVDTYDHWMYSELGNKKLPTVYIMNESGLRTVKSGVNRNRLLDVLSRRAYGTFPILSNDKMLWEYCGDNRICLLYANKNGNEDEEEMMRELSKQLLEYDNLKVGMLSDMSPFKSACGLPDDLDSVLIATQLSSNTYSLYYKRKLSVHRIRNFIHDIEYGNAIFRRFKRPFTIDEPTFMSNAGSAVRVLLRWMSRYKTIILFSVIYVLVMVYLTTKCCVFLFSAVMDDEITPNMDYKKQRHRDDLDRKNK